MTGRQREEESGTHHNLVLPPALIPQKQPVSTSIEIFTAQRELTEEE
ncbi:MAG TPA: hypothetical protein VGO47_14405 [Chlamydiales bacterium]|nr:hypothetical protein [Chlamydiales bacterium]